ncbi:MAG: VPLPA-CTERM sorting domain-containing protein [Pseudomonadota bacterium]
MKKSTFVLALTSSLATSAANALIIDMNYNGLFTMLNPTGSSIQNTSFPYYGDPTWGNGQRTQVTGTIQIDTNTGIGAATINPFEFFNGTPGFSASNFKLKSIGGSLLIGNMNASWNNNNFDIQLVLDASGLFGALSNNLPSTGTIFNHSTCVNLGLPCATPASNNISSGNYPIGSIPLATTSFNVVGQKLTGTAISDLSLGVDDGIGGSPVLTGPSLATSINIDFTSLAVTNVSVVPIPAAIWLFGTGLLSLAGVARRKHYL